MGGSSKKVTVGYKYYVGLHMVLIQGTADRLQRIRVDERTAWTGIQKNGPITINKPGLFGGESREGGITGTLDFENGNGGQQANSYLSSRLGSLVPAFRGVTAVVLRQMFMGLNPYLKKWDFRLQRIHIRHDGLRQWYDSRSEIRVGDFTTTQSFLFAIDVSGSMGTIVDGSTTRLDIAKAALLKVLDDVDQLRIDSGVTVNIAVCLWSDSGSTMTRNNMTTSDKNSLKDFISGATANGNTNFDAPFSAANGFFNSSISDGRRRSMFFITDGAPSGTSLDDALVTGADILDQNSGDFSSSNGTAVDVYGVNIDLSDIQYTIQVVNTGNVPVVSSTNTDELYQIIFGLMGDYASMNPAHIIRECLTDPDWGMGYQDSDIDDVSFRNAANTLYAEKLGMCIMWERQTAIDDFIEIIKRHINAELYVDRSTGKFTLKLIRDDFDEESLPIFGPHNIEKVTEFKRPTFGELTNAITVNYWDILLGDTSTVTVQDIALAQQQGNTIQTTVDYNGFVSNSVASRIAQRDLGVLSTPLISCTLYVNRDAEDLNLGDPFILNWPDYGVDNVVMRVTGLNFGDGKKKRIRLQCSQDAFAMPEQAFIPAVPPDWEDPTKDPMPVTAQAAFEVPYLELVQLQSQATVDEMLSTNPELGYLGAAAGRPASSALNARFYSDSGAGYEDVGHVDFCPSATLAEDISEIQTLFNIADENELDSVEIGSWFQIDDELLSVEAINEGIIEVKRGVLDSVPTKHTSGAALVFWDAFAEGDPTEYVESDVVNVKLATVTGGGELALNLAPVSTVEMRSRAIRPYPPGDFKINGEYFPAEAPGDLEVTWTTRNRVQQTGGALVGFADGAVTPEAGTTYKVEVTGPSGDVLHSQDGITDLFYTVPAGDLIDSPVTLKLYSVRDGYESYYAQTCEMTTLVPPSNLTGINV